MTFCSFAKTRQKTWTSTVASFNINPVSFRFIKFSWFRWYTKVVWHCVCFNAKMMKLCMSTFIVHVVSWENKNELGAKLLVNLFCFHLHCKKKDGISCARLSTALNYAEKMHFACKMKMPSSLWRQLQSEDNRWRHTSQKHWSNSTQAQLTH